MGNLEHINLFYLRFCLLFFRLLNQVISSHVEIDSPRSAATLSKDVEESEKKNSIIINKLHITSDRLKNITAEVM